MGNDKDKRYYEERIAYLQKEVMKHSNEIQECQAKLDYLHKPVQTFVLVFQVPIEARTEKEAVELYHRNHANHCYSATTMLTRYHRQTQIRILLDERGPCPYSYRDIKTEER